MHNWNFSVTLEPHRLSLQVPVDSTGLGSFTLTILDVVQGCLRSGQQK